MWGSDAQICEMMFKMSIGSIGIPASLLWLLDEVKLRELICGMKTENHINMVGEKHIILYTLLLMFVGASVAFEGRRDLWRSKTNLNVESGGGVGRATSSPASSAPIAYHLCQLWYWKEMGRWGQP
jgi:hypothetical protein